MWWCVACCMLCLPPQHLYFRGLVAVEVCALGFRLVSHTQGTCLIPSSSPPPHSPLVPSRYFLGSCHLWDSDTDMGCTHLVPAEIMLKLTSAIKASICTHTTCTCSHAAESAQATWHVIILVCHPSACSYTPSLSALPLSVCLSICLPCPWLVCLTDLTQVVPSLLSLLSSLCSPPPCCLLGSLLLHTGGQTLSCLHRHTNAPRGRSHQCQWADDPVLPDTHAPDDVQVLRLQLLLLLLHDHALSTRTSRHHD